MLRLPAKTHRELQQRRLLAAVGVSGALVSAVALVAVYFHHAKQPVFAVVIAACLLVLSVLALAAGVLED